MDTPSARRELRQSYRTSKKNPLQPQGISTTDLDHYLERVEKSKLYSKNFLGIELLGKGVTYSAQYERALGVNTNIGFGYGYQELELNPIVGNATLTVDTLPLYTHYNMLSGRHRPFLVGGVTIIRARLNADVDASQFISEDDVRAEIERYVPLNYSGGGEIIVPAGFIGTGYEFRTHGGFVFRAALLGFAYPIVTPFAGLTFGGHF